MYLYEQQLPKRRVAVKVLLTERMSSGSVEEFTAEANVMAMLSTHPAIVTIYQAGVARDGRPYLVMEYCPKPNLQVRYRREPFSVAESLRVGVQVAAAVETAHRAGVLHRDIKPANILVTEYNRPALTDFGIASTTSAAAESAGLSIPWSPPESFADMPRSDPRSDVYALGATVYTLLAGRSPFEMPGSATPPPSSSTASSRSAAAARPRRRARLARARARAGDGEVAGRSLRERARVRAGAAEGADRAVALGHADRHPRRRVAEDASEDDDDGLTRVRGVVSIDPADLPPPASPVRRPAPSRRRRRPLTPRRFVRAADGDRRARRPAPPDDGRRRDVLRALASRRAVGSLATPRSRRAGRAALGRTARARVRSRSRALAPRTVDRAGAGRGRRSRDRRRLASRPLGGGSDDSPAPVAVEPQDPISAVVPEPTTSQVGRGRRRALHLDEPRPAGRRPLHVRGRDADAEPEFESVAARGHRPRRRVGHDLHRGDPRARERPVIGPRRGCAP